MLFSEYLEVGEIEPLIAESEEFVRRVSDGDANDIVEDFDADILDHALIDSVVKVRIQKIEDSCEKSQLNRFLGFCRGIVCDGRITLAEAKAIASFVERYPSLLETVGVRQIYISSVDAVADGIVSEEESDELCEVIGHVVGDCYGDTGIAQTTGVANFHETRLESIEVDLDGAIFVLTGNFKAKPRSIFEKKLEAYGALKARSVSGKVDFLIVGGEASRDWIELNRGTKIRKAQELRLKSERPLFVSESQLLRLMAL